MDPESKPSGMGIREYARHRKGLLLAGGTHHAVQVAIDSGRLSKSLSPDRKRIADPEAADIEWAASTLDRVPHTGPTSSGANPPDLAESRARREAASAALVEIELAEKRGELVLARDVEAQLVGVFAHCKTKLLAVAARARQRDPALTGSQLELFESLIREALEDLAGEVEGDE